MTILHTILDRLPLGEQTHTGKTGSYEVVYNPTHFITTGELAVVNKLSPSSEPIANIIVRVYGHDGKLLKESLTYYSAPRHLQVDVDLSGTTYQGPSEFEKIINGVQPFIGKVPLSQLKEDQEAQDITFLSQKTGLARNEITALAIAFHFAADTKLPAPTYCQVPDKWRWLAV